MVLALVFGGLEYVTPQNSPWEPKTTEGTTYTPCPDKYAYKVSDSHYVRCEDFNAYFETKEKNGDYAKYHYANDKDRESRFLAMKRLSLKKCPLNNYIEGDEYEK